MALVLVFCGLGMSGVGTSSHGVCVVREAESILPDHEVVIEPTIDLRKCLQELIEKRQQLIAEPVLVDRKWSLKEISQELCQLDLH